MSEEEEIIVVCPGACEDDEDGDGEFTLSRAAAKRCDVIKAHLEMVKEGDMEMNNLPLPNIDASLMSTIVEFLESPYQERPNGELSQFEVDWLPADPKEIAPLILAANYLDCQEMMDALTQHTANLMKGGTPEALREMFGTPDDIPADKKKEIHEQNKFLLEK
jgi:Skp1 family, dimerisation domain